MKTITVIFFFLILSENSYTQDFQVFVSGGSNYFALVGGGLFLGKDTTFNFNTGGFGFNLGFGALRKYEKVEFSAALEFSQRQTSRYNTYFSRDEVRNYISFPLQFKYEIIKNTRLIFQNRIDYLIHTQKLSLINLDTGESYLSKIDIGIGGGVSYLLSSFELQLIGDFGLVWVEKRPISNFLPNDSIFSKSRSIKLNLIYMF
jgi:hypothetical protein